MFFQHGVSILCIYVGVCVCTVYIALLRAPGLPLAIDPTICGTVCVFVVRASEKGTVKESETKKGMICFGTTGHRYGCVCVCSYVCVKGKTLPEGG